MDAFNFCWYTVLAEGEKYGISLQKFRCNINDEYNMDFNDVSNRLAYVYKFGSFNILLFKACMSVFIKNCVSAESILYELFSKTPVKICSLSSGPGIDIVGLSCALAQWNESLKINLFVQLINKYSSWENFFCQMMNDAKNATNSSLSLSNVNILSENSKLIECDLLTSLPPEAQYCLQESDVILMFKTFTSAKIQNDIIPGCLKKILLHLKPGAIIFFMNSKEKCKQFVKISECGNVLFGPTKVELKSVPYDIEVCKFVGVPPFIRGNTHFMVWKKHVAVCADLKSVNSTMDTYSLLSTRHLKESNVKNCNVIEDFLFCHRNLSDEKLLSDTDYGTAEFHNTLAHADCFTSPENISLQKSDAMHDENAFELLQKEDFIVRLENVFKRCEDLVSSLEDTVSSIKIATGDIHYETKNCCCECKMLSHCRNFTECMPAGRFSCHCRSCSKKQLCCVSACHDYNKVSGNSICNLMKNKWYKSDSNLVLNQEMSYFLIPLCNDSLSNVISTLGNINEGQVHKKENS